MESKAKFLGHALHQQLIPFPLGLLATAVIFDLLYLFTGEGELANVAYWMIVAGVISGVVASPWGTIDWLAIPTGTRAKTVGLFHGAGNFLMLVLFAVSWLLRRDAPAEPDGTALTLSFIGVALLGLTGWLGGELVDRLAVGIDEGAHLNAPNSLSRRHAHEPSGG